MTQRNLIERALEEEWDDDFTWYEADTVDPGPGLLLGTLLVCILLYAALPFLVAIGNRREKRQRALNAQLQDDSEEDAPHQIPSPNGIMIDHPQKDSPGEVASVRSTSSDSGDRKFKTDNASDTMSVASRGSHLAQEILRNAHQAGGHVRTRNKIERRLQQMDDGPHNPDEDLLETHVHVDAVPKGTDPHVLKRSPSNSASMSSVSVPRAMSDIGSALDEMSSGEEVIFEKMKYDEEMSGRRSRSLPSPFRPRHASELHHSDNAAEKKKQMTYLARAWDDLLEIVEWDDENRRLFSLAFPYMVEALFQSISEAARVALIGRFYGTRALSAFVVVDLVVGLTTGFFGGIIDAQGVLATQSRGAGTTKLTGQYTQIGILLYVVAATPISLLWLLWIDDVLVFVGFDAETVTIGQGFTGYAIAYELIDGVASVIYGTLDITGHELCGTVMASLQDVLGTMVVLVLALTAEDKPNLLDAGRALVLLSAVLLFVNALFVAWKGWWRKYYSGLIYSFALRNWKATKSIIFTSIPLSLGYLLTYGEWELLTIFAKFLGPAEVAAWGVLGSVWDILEECTEAIAEAGEVRCAYLLGAGRPMQAKMSAYKAIMLGFVGSVLMTSIVFMCGENIAVWMTADPTLQRLVADLIPLFGLGNIGLTLGTVAWTLVGAQGRYSLSTAVGFAGSWAVTVPLAAIFSIVVNVNLQGQTAAVVIGYMVSGTMNTYFLLRSDWHAISKKVIDRNAANGVELDSDQASSSSAESTTS